METSNSPCRRRRSSQAKNLEDVHTFNSTNGSVNKRSHNVDDLPRRAMLFTSENVQVVDLQAFSSKAPLQIFSSCYTML